MPDFVNNVLDLIGNTPIVSLASLGEPGCAQVLGNIEKALAAEGAGWGNVVQFTTYLVHSQDIPNFMDFRLREFPKFFPDGAYPPNTLLMVDRLVKEEFLVEVQTIAAI